MPLRDPTELRPPRARSRWGLVLLALLIAAAAGFGWYWWTARHAPQPVAATAPAVAVQTAPVQQPAEPEAPPPAAAPADSGAPQNPIEEPEAPQPALPALADSDATVGKAVKELLGAQRAEAFLQLDGFVRRVVATVDNLAREQAPARLWPVHPMQGRFTVDEAGGAQQIAAANAMRYDAFVSFAEAVPVEAAARLYTRLYPLFQVAYEELGFPGKYFNDRLVAVIDHLLAAPEPQGPVAVHLVQVAGQVPSLRPWVRYEYADPQLQALSAGQKIMVRVGLKNEQRLKAVLSKVRARVAKARPLGGR
ncbi:MAG: DUF3014 domain-containing protein [Comamonas sp.]|nr:DUF3014 domain-containing protein [Comamonas sp.]